MRLFDVVMIGVGLGSAAVYIVLRFRWLRRTRRPTVLAGPGHLQYLLLVAAAALGSALLVQRAMHSDAGLLRAAWLAAGGFAAGMIPVAIWTWREASRRNLIP